MSGIHVSNTDDIFFAILKELKPDSSPLPISSSSFPIKHSSSPLSSPLVNSITQFTNVDQYLLIASIFFFWFH